MENDKIIEEMANIIYKRANTIERFGLTGMELCKKIAEELIKHYQPKLPEGSVVLSKEEYEILINQNKGLKEENHTLRLENNDTEAQVKQTRKETAKEILQEIKSRCKELENKYSHLCNSKKECLMETCRYEGVLAVKRELYNLAQKYGIEVEE